MIAIPTNLAPEPTAKTFQTAVYNFNSPAMAIVALVIGNLIVIAVLALVFLLF